MDTKLVVIFILSGILGAIIVITGCIKVLGKNGELNLKTAGFILAGFIFVALPVLGSISIEWGEFKFLVHTTNRQMMEIQKSLDSLKTENEKLIADLDRLKTSINDYGQVMQSPHISSAEKNSENQKIKSEIDRISYGVRVQNAALDKALIKSDSIVEKLTKSRSGKKLKI